MAIIHYRKIQMDTLFDKEAEKAVLGALLDDMTVYQNVARILTGAESFMTRDHQLVYDAISTMYAEKKTTDPIVVADYLRKTGNINRVGGSDYLYELYAPIVETESSVFYAAIVEDFFIQRKTASMLVKTHQNILSGEMTADDVFENLHKQVESYREKKASNSPQVWKTYTETYDAEFPPLEWIIPDILPNGFTLLAGAPKVGKSIFAWNAAISASMGARAFGSIELDKKHNVLYICSEDSERLINNRMQKWTKPNNKPDNFHIAYEYPKLNLMGISQLDRDIDKYNADFVIIDTWKHVCPENNRHATSYEKDYENMIPVQKLCNNKSVSLLIITHLRKASDADNIANEIQGSTAMQGAVETYLILKRQDDAHILFVTGKHDSPQSFAFTFDKEYLVWQLDGLADDVFVNETEQAIQDVLLAAGDAGLSVSEISEEIDKKKNHTINILRAMLADAKIHQARKRANYVHNDYVDTENDIHSSINL